MALEQDAKKGKPVFCIDLLSFCDESRIARDAAAQLFASRRAGMPGRQGCRIREPVRMHGGKGTGCCCVLQMQQGVTIG
jgi:hypothetical protein